MKSKDMARIGIRELKSQQNQYCIYIQSNENIIGAQVWERHSKTWQKMEAQNLNIKLKDTKNRDEI